ncbi:unnamed protein product, partial [marine sediment metagenome]
LNLETGQTITSTGCRFEDPNFRDVMVGPNTDSVPTIISFINYNNTNPGTRDEEPAWSADPAVSQVIWAGTMQMYDTNDPSDNVVRGDQDRPFLRLKFKPSGPPGSQHDEGILQSLVILLTTGLSITDSDVTAVKIYRDDGNDVFEPVTDTLVSSGTDVFNELTADVTLTTPQTITATFWVAYDISFTAGTGATKIGARVVTATVIAPHTLDSTNFPFGSAYKAIFAAQYRIDGQIKLERDAAYIGDDIYNLTGKDQTRIGNTADGQLLSYYIRIENDGTSNDLFTVTGTGGNANWTI